MQRVELKMTGSISPHAGYNVVMVRVEQVIESWKSIRQDTITAVEEFPAGEFGFRPAPDVMTFGEHSGCGRRVDWYAAGRRGKPLDACQSRKAEAALPKHSCGCGSVRFGRRLAESVEERAAALAARNAEFYARIITKFDGERVTRLEMLQAIKEHELTHRALLFFYSRIKGIVPVTTRRRMARQAAQ